MDSMEQLIEKTENNVLKTYARKPYAFEKGEGMFLYDTEGNAWLDFNSGLGVNALGHAHPAVVELIREQAGKVMHTSNLYHIPSQTALAEKIIASSFGERVFFCNSGTEAVEAMLKFARKWGKKYSPEKTDIIAFGNSFHGRTFGSLSATMQEKYRKPFEPMVPGFREAVFNNIESVENLTDEKTAAIIVEPVQGEGGVNVATVEFMKGLERICRELEILLILDEVQCGMGRTGKLFAYMHYDIEPDMMALAKPLAGGLPIGATVIGKRVWPDMCPGEHASTFGGNHFVTSVACGVFDLVSDTGFIGRVAGNGDYLRKGLETLKEKYSSIKEVRSLGLISGVQVDFPAAEAVEYMEREFILICIAGPDVVRFIPPLIASREDIDRVLNVFENFLKGKKV